MTALFSDGEMLSRILRRVDAHNNPVHLNPPNRHLKLLK